MYNDFLVVTVIEDDDDKEKVVVESKGTLLQKYFTVLGKMTNKRKTKKEYTLYGPLGGVAHAHGSHIFVLLFVDHEHWRAANGIHVYIA